MFFFSLDTLVGIVNIPTAEEMAAEAARCKAPKTA